MTAPATRHDYGAGPVDVWYAFSAEWSAAPGRWPLRVQCCAAGPVAAMRRMRRSFPPEPGTRLVRLTWSPLAPLMRPAGTVDR